MFFDDILIYSKIEFDHEQHLAMVLAMLEEQQLVDNIKKCEFKKSKMACLGHIISLEGVTVAKHSSND